MSGGQLQVRQGSASREVVPGAVCITWGSWTDVLSSGWLIGYVLPGSGMVYEFRNAPQEADNG